MLGVNVGASSDRLGVNVGVRLGVNVSVSTQ